MSRDSPRTLCVMGLSNSKEPDAKRAERVAQDGCILRGIVGSTVHGLSNPGTDDRNEMGGCIEPAEYVAGLRPFDHWVFRTQPEGLPSGLLTDTIVGDGGAVGGGDGGW